jgi:hypothetical protein
VYFSSDVERLLNETIHVEGESEELRLVRVEELWMSQQNAGSEFGKILIYFK